jgi:hypothetical protein
VLNFATLVVAGRPWGVTQACALWGSKAVEAADLNDPVFWPFWEEPTRVEAMIRPLASDATTIMNLARDGRRAGRANERPATIMNRIARGNTDAEVADLADCFPNLR